MRRFFLLILILLYALPVSAKHLHPEKYYQAQWCAQKKGITEYKLKDGSRVDCLTDKYAVEFDFAPKWAECIGQALYYGGKTKRIPACALIIENKKDLKHLYKLRYAVYNRKKYHGMQINEFKTFTVKPILFDDIIIEEEF